MHWHFCFWITTFSFYMANPSSNLYKWSTLQVELELCMFVHQRPISRQWEVFLHAYVLVTFPVVSVNTSSVWPSNYTFPSPKCSNNRTQAQHTILCDIDISILVWVVCHIICSCMTVYQKKNCCEWNKWAARKRDNIFDGGRWWLITSSKTTPAYIINWHCGQVLTAVGNMGVLCKYEKNSMNWLYVLSTLFIIH